MVWVAGPVSAVRPPVFPADEHFDFDLYTCEDGLLCRFVAVCQNAPFDQRMKRPAQLHLF